jgi:hypothetical protein
MPTRKELYEAISHQRAEQAQEASRETIRDLAICAALCLGWATLGIFCILWSAHTSSLFWGKISFFSGIALGNGGVIFTLLGAYRRGEKRGDW